MMRRTKGEQKAYLDGFEWCADCIEKYLTDEGKRKLECFLFSVRKCVEDEVENEEQMQIVIDIPKELQKHIKSIGYKGCKNCEHQISPLRMCRWAEQGGDGCIHLICPMWDKAESEDKA